MIKGCTKRVIVVKDVSSDIFEEAYFILRPTSANTKVKKSESDIISEANRIVSTQSCDRRTNISLKAPHPKKSKLHDIIIFAIGFFSAAATYGIYYLL